MKTENLEKVKLNIHLVCGFDMVRSREITERRVRVHLSLAKAGGQVSCIEEGWEREMTGECKNEVYEQEQVTLLQ